MNNTDDEKFHSYNRGCGCTTCRQTEKVRALVAGLCATTPVWPWESPLCEEVPDGPARREYDQHQATLNRASEAMGPVLEQWRSWPDTGELRVGIVVDVSEPMAPFDGVVADLAWVLLAGLYESVRDAPRSWPVHPAFVLADNRPDPAQPGDDQSVGQSGGGQSGGGTVGARRSGIAPEVDIAPTLADGVALAARRAHLDTAGGARLLVLITGGHGVQAGPVRDQIRALPPGCGVQIIYPTALDTDNGVDQMQRTGAAVADLGADSLTLLDIHAPIPGADLGRHAVDAMHTADPSRALPPTTPR